jgi:poly(A) polymerase
MEQNIDISNLIGGALNTMPEFRLVGGTAAGLGLDCYIIGGWVRDLFLGRPSKDIDLVVVGPLGNTERPGIVLAEALKDSIGSGEVTVYPNFGTAQLKTPAGVELEFVGARKESYDRGSRKPITEDGTLEDDQNRRDFTINAMAICLNPSRFGELLDPFGGLSDLQSGIIRTPLDPDTTFSDDPLRMLRAIRFATQLGFQILDPVFESMARVKDRIRIISTERIGTEISKILLAEHPSVGFILLQKCGLLEIILPEISGLAGVDVHQGRGHKDNFYHTMEVLENAASLSRDPDWDSGFKMFKGEHRLWFRVAALLHDIGKPRSKRWEDGVGWTFHNHENIGESMIDGVFKRLSFPRDQRLTYCRGLVKLHMRPIIIANENVTDSAVRRLLFDAGDLINDLMLLCTADITTGNSQKKTQLVQGIELVKQRLIDLEESDRIRNFQPPVNGAEIMEIFGLPPCELVGTLKGIIKDAILDGLIPNSHDEAKEFILNEAKRQGLV